MIQLTPDQRLAIQKGQPIHVHDADLDRDVVILSAETFAAWEEIVRDEKEQEAIVKMGMRNTAQRLIEDEDGSPG